jgi:glyoxylase I family protein
MALSGAAHVAITVTDLARSKEWYGRVLDWTPVMEGDGVGVAFCLGEIPGGPMVGLRQYDNGSGDAFDPTRTGLDHLAFAETSLAEMPDWERRFAELGVTYEQTQKTSYGYVLNFKDPDGIALEIYSAPE